MTLHEMVTRFPDRFYTQAWYYGEPFVNTEPRPWLGWPSDVSPFLPGQVDLAYTAADLAALWLEDPSRALWDRYLWTSDVDAKASGSTSGATARAWRSTATFT